jgi:hypothetical protein
MGDGTTIGDDELSQRLGDRNNPIEESDTDIHRAGPGEGVRAPLTTEGADHAEYSIFDGKGNEQVVVVGDNKEGFPVQGTGDSSEEAAEKVADLDTKITGAFTPNPHDK